MAKITQLKRGSENVYPLVHMDGVVDDNGNSISTMWDTKQATLVSGSNIKTVNGTSLLGSGDLAVVSVDAGDISVLQSTGDSQVDVMSQKAVTDYGKRTTIKDASSIIASNYEFPHDIYVPILWCSNENGAAPIETNLNVRGDNWRFEGSFAKMQATPAANYPTIISQYDSGSTANYGFYLGLTSAPNKVYGRYGHASNLNEYTIPNMEVGKWYNFELQKGKMVVDGVETVLSTASTSTAGTTNLKFNSGATKIRLGEIRVYEGENLRGKFIPSRRISDNVVGMYDMVSGNFYTSTSEIGLVGSGEAYSFDSDIVDAKTLKGLVAQETGQSEGKLMSQKVITDKLSTIIYESILPTYLNGKYIYLKLTDYPDFDPRTSDGISIVFSKNLSSDPLNCCLLSLWNPNGGGINNNYANTHFGFWHKNVGVIKFYLGKLNNYGTTIESGGYYVNEGSAARHCVLTYDFKTGTAKYYRNGVLAVTQTTENFDKQTVIDNYFTTCTHLQISGIPPKTGIKMLGLAVFGHVLTDDDVTKLYGAGNSSIRKTLVPKIWKANNLHPIYPSNWSMRVEAGTSSALTDGYSITQSSVGSIMFGFTGITGVINNVIYEWDMEVTSGTCVHNSSDRTSRTMRYNSLYNKVFTIYNSNNEDVTLETLSIGTYHVICKPDNISAGSVNSSNLTLIYIFTGCTNDFTMNVTNLKITERGAALECTPETLRGTYWEQTNGTKLLLNTSSLYNNVNLSVGTDVYTEDTVIYSNSIYPQFNGQTAVDITNDKLYMGYLTGTGGTWKQINNS